MYSTVLCALIHPPAQEADLVPDRGGRGAAPPQEEGSTARRYPAGTAVLTLWRNRPVGTGHCYI